MGTGTHRRTASTRTGAVGATYTRTGGRNSGHTGQYVTGKARSDRGLEFGPTFPVMPEGLTRQGVALGVGACT
ncbi:hypothetical protein OG413_17300 [Streptomyces sp. NBC_01433]|uniref:hypothetical protein n=1 Tax=Streptomyces sp. NBC_01433 TaxID=2903864 RepID=UPI00225A61C4|nr:hypothetical protein [Streptomyces sp. NBC_01433]MCX4677037.1 hypothetical protein [Streptomyces sp. NBC_01433]